MRRFTKICQNIFSVNFCEILGKFWWFNNYLYKNYEKDLCKELYLSAPWKSSEGSEGALLSPKLAITLFFIFHNNNNNIII